MSSSVEGSGTAVTVTGTVPAIDSWKGALTNCRPWNRLLKFELMTIFTGPLPAGLKCSAARISGSAAPGATPKPDAAAKTAVPGAVVAGSKSGPDVAPRKERSDGFVTLTLNPQEMIMSVEAPRP